MPKLPTAQDVIRARRQATEAVTDMLEQARTPLYAVVGAGDLATEAVREYVTKARAEATGQARDVQTKVTELQARLTELQDRLVEVRTQVRTQVRSTVNELPEVRGRLDAAELRQALENYVQSLQDLYERLATRGESTLDKLRQQPQVKRTLGRVEDVAETTEERVGKLVEDARELTYEVLGRVSRRTRGTGEQAARTVEQAADELAGTVRKAGENTASTVEEAGDEVAGTIQAAGDKASDKAATGTTRKATTRTQPAKTATGSTTRRTTTRRTGTRA